MVIELRVVQFWSESILVISNRTRAARSFDFEITRMTLRPNCTPLSSITIIYLPPGSNHFYWKVNLQRMITENFSDDVGCVFWRKGQWKMQEIHVMSQTKILLLHVQVSLLLLLEVLSFDNWSSKQKVTLNCFHFTNT